MVAVVAVVQIRDSYAALEKTDGARLHTSGIVGTLDMLVTPPERREAAVLHIEGPPWRPRFQH